MEGGTHRVGPGRQHSFSRRCPPRCQGADMPDTVKAAQYMRQQQQDACSQPTAPLQLAQSQGECLSTKEVSTKEEPWE